MKPILFNTEMVKAILDGRKTQTRRVCKGQPQDDGKCSPEDIGYKPPYKPGDILWVRETWDNIPVSPGGHMRMGGKFYYKADGDIRPDGWQGNWHPSIHMPRRAARIFLRVKDVRAERLKEMSANDAMDEGFADWNEFARLWDSTIKPEDIDKFGWNANPWVWVIEFERTKEDADE